ncbi:hypothetical protein QBC32DRAFT_206482, partial [Pseudoneurospora amorphoporcata]
SYTRFYRFYQQRACFQQAYLTYYYFRGFSPFNSIPKSLLLHHLSVDKAPIGNAKGANPPPPSSPRPEDAGRPSSTTLFLVFTYFDI